MAQTNTFTTEELNKVLIEVLAGIFGQALVEEATVPEAPKEPLYTVYIAKKGTNVKYKYVGINNRGLIAAFSEEADVLGTGTDSIGKYPLSWIEENYPQFAKEPFLVKQD